MGNTGVGSPPRVRGIANIKHLTQRILGITPACAGNSQRVAVHLSDAEDHPRVCGE